MKSEKDPKRPPKTADDENSRREFLRKSVYAAYATPLITALLVEQASARQSGNGGGHETFCDRNPWHKKCQ
jgi:hypothetical protein